MDDEHTSQAPAAPPPSEPPPPWQADPLLIGHLERGQRGDDRRA
jgi:hypothetical protein